MKKINKGRSQWLSGSMALLGGVFLLLLGSKASAQIATYTGSGGTSTTVTYYANETGTALQKTGFGTNSPCASGGLSGMTVSTSVSSFTTSGPRVYFTVTANAGYTLNVTSFTAGLRRSGTGPAKVRYAYSTDGGTTWTNDGTDHVPTSSGCGSSATSGWGTGSLPTGASSVIFALYPFGPSASTGTFQINSITIGGSVVASVCSGTPAAGSVSASPATLCGSGSSLLTLTGASSGAGISYQWESSSDNITFSNIAGATNNTYNASLSATTYYRATTTCSVSSLSATSASSAVTVSSAPVVGPITGSTSVVIGTPSTLANATSGGTWSSSTTSVATIGTSGLVNGINPGTSTISYRVISGTCTTAVATVVTVLEPNTLAVYSGAGGNGLGTSVIGLPNETVTSLATTGFGTNSPCGTGGLSGLTVNTVYATYSAAGPRAYYQITPDAGYQLNITGIRAITRESGTGPTLARLAYSLDGGTTWIDDATDHTQFTGSSCGAASNNFTWTSGITLMGVTSSIIVAVYPYAPGASTGTFQLNRLTVYGNVAPAGSCTGTTAGTASAATSSFCDNGSTTISLSGGSTGSGISYQWQESADGVTFTDIAGATNTSFATGTLSATTYYHVVTTCAFVGTPSTSLVAVVSVNPAPSAGTITGVPPYIFIGSPATLSNATTGGIWSSSNIGVATVGSADGVVTGLIPGTTVITYSVTDAGCTGRTTAGVNVLLDGTIAAYLGADGESVATIGLADVTTTDITATGFGTNPPCARGGISGLTNNGVTTYSSSNAHAYFKVTPISGFYMDVTGFHVTLRRSGSGIQKVRMAYSLDNGATWSDDGIDQAPDNAGCSFSTTNYSYAATLPAGVTSTGDGVIFAVFPYDPIAAGGTIQINSFDIVGSVTECPGVAAITEGDLALCSGVTATLTDATTGGAWSSSNAAVASVGSADGVVAGVAAGTAVITYGINSVCGFAYATVNVTVNASPSVAAITGNEVVCGLGNTITLSTTTTDGSWSTSDIFVADVDGAGVVTSVNEGTAEITYTVEDPINGCLGAASVIVTVSATPDVAAIGGQTTVCLEATTQLTNDTEGGVWSSSNTSVATAGTAGLVSGVAAGTAIISYTVTNSTGCSSTATVEVTVVVCGGKGATVATATSTDVQLYPNPASAVLNVVAAETVNVTIYSVDGKVLMNEKNATSINVSNLAKGVYVIRVYNQNNMLIKTARFTKN